MSLRNSRLVLTLLKQFLGILQRCLEFYFNGVRIFLFVQPKDGHWAQSHPLCEGELLFWPPSALFHRGCASASHTSRGLLCTKDCGLFLSFNQIPLGFITTWVSIFFFVCSHYITNQSSCLPVTKQLYPGALRALTGEEFYCIRNERVFMAVFLVHDFSLSSFQVEGVDPALKKWACYWES